jgi:hypothetical protein
MTDTLPIAEALRMAERYVEIMTRHDVDLAIWTDALSKLTEAEKLEVEGFLINAPVIIDALVQAIQYFVLSETTPDDATFH